MAPYSEIMKINYLFLSKTIVFFLTVPFFSISLFAQESFFNQLPDTVDAPITLNVRVNLKGVIKEKFKETYYPAQISYLNTEGDSIHLRGKMKARGNSRKKNCYFPPIKLKLKKKSLEENNFTQEFNKYKLVLQCKKTKMSELYISKELIAYQIGSTITPNNLRAKPVLYNIIDPETNEVTEQLHGFIIESLDELAFRLDAKIIERKRIVPTQLDKETYFSMCLFQYLIGNTDWHVGSLHNLKLLKISDRPRITPIPYDFDYSGLVNTNYAVVHESIPIKSVRTRYFMGEKVKEDIFSPVINQFIANKDAIISLVNNYNAIQEKQRSHTAKYLEEFFKAISNSKKAKRMFLE